jgi:ribosome recycling factor
MHPFVSAKKADFDATVDQFRQELASLRTGRANPALVDGITVIAYDAPMELKSVASINVQDAKTLVIEPWDKSLLQAIEKAIRDAGLGINPAVDGSIVRISLPPMTEENRKNLVKNMKEKLEETRVRLRGVREEARNQILDKEKDKAFGEDEKFKVLDELDRMTKEYVTKVEEIGEKKEAEIMTV